MLRQLPTAARKSLFPGEGMLLTFDERGGENPTLILVTCMLFVSKQSRSRTSHLSGA
jgi:hypothetical protein